MQELRNFRVPTLLELAENEDWLDAPVRTRSGLGRVIPDLEKVSVGYYHSNSTKYAKLALKDKPVNKIRIRIGNKLLKKLDWKLGDKIEALQNKNDLFTFKIFKVSHGGLILGKEGKHCAAININWTTNIPLKHTFFTEVEHLVYVGNLLIVRAKV